MERAPVSLKSFNYPDTDMVHYQGRYHPGLKRDHQLVTGVSSSPCSCPTSHIGINVASEALPELDWRARGGRHKTGDDQQG